MLSIIIYLQKRMSSHIETVEARMLATGTAYVIAHESEKNGLYQYGMEVLKWKRQCHCKTSSVPNDLYQWWKEK
jgi:hypothetical protein